MIPRPSVMNNTRKTSPQENQRTFNHIKARTEEQMSAFASTHAYAARSTSPPLLINRDLRWCEKAQVFDVRRQLQV